MRRKDKEIADMGEIIEIVRECKVCRLALSDNDRPYVIPLNYGFTFENNQLTLFFHSAPEGKKNEIMKANPLACFEVDCAGSLIEADDPCKYSYAFKSAIGFGKIVFVESPGEKARALNEIMKHQTGKDTLYNYPPESLEKLAVYKMLVEELTGKQKRLPAPS
ncbi:MAG: pyridoxamine 5'-phosphate oxidase family protein [Spirochaetes bacterium]|nr:pyridoxamine 5'-phosphate oxidase family protein [Spirochaetota bacterium]